MAYPCWSSPEKTPRHFGETFPWGTVLVNVSGSLVIGFFATLTGPDGRWLVSGNQDPSVHLWIPAEDIELQMSGLAAIYGSKLIPKSLQGKIDRMFEGSGLLASQRLDPKAPDTYRHVRIAAYRALGFDYVPVMPISPTWKFNFDQFLKFDVFDFFD